MIITITMVSGARHEYNTDLFRIEERGYWHTQKAIVVTKINRVIGNEYVPLTKDDEQYKACHPLDKIETYELST